MKLAYQALDGTGRLINDYIEASDVLDATEQLRRDGLFVTELKEARNSERAELGRPSRSKRKVNHLKHVALFTRQLSVLVSTGTPLVQAITALEKQSRNESWREVVTTVREKLEGGESFSQALESRSDCFDAIFRSLVQAGESGGQLDVIVDEPSDSSQAGKRQRGAA